MNLAELGSVLEKKRQSKNLSFDDVSKAIKIPVKSLIALEHGDLEYIGYETYYKNFLKCYALYLGYSLDEYTELTKDVTEFSAQIMPPKSLEAQLAETQPEMTKPRGRKLAVQLLVLAIIGGSAYFYLSQKDSVMATFVGAQDEQKIETKEIQPAPKSSDVQSEEASSVQAAQEVPETVNAVQQGNAAAGQDTAGTQGTAAQNEQQAPVFAAETDKPVQKEDVSQTAADNAGLVEQKMPEDDKNEEQFDLQAFLKDNPSAKVIDWTQVKEPVQGMQQAVMHAKQDCWMQYTQDGKSSHFTLKRGEQRVFDFKKSLSFRIANGSAITLYHNKKPVTVGDSSKMREVTLK